MRPSHPPLLGLGLLWVSASFGAVVVGVRDRRRSGYINLFENVRLHVAVIIAAVVVSDSDVGAYDLLLHT